MANSSLPMSVSDTLLHDKDSDRTERVILPITRYVNVLNSPKVVENGGEILGAPFSLIATDTETLTVSDIRKYCDTLI